MEINAFVTLRGTFSLGSANQLELPPAVREMLRPGLTGGIPAGSLILPSQHMGVGSIMPGQLMGVGGMGGAVNALGAAPDALASGAAADGPAAPGDAGSGLPVSGSTAEMNERIRRLSGAIAGSIFQDLVSGTLRLGEPGPPAASAAAIENLERGVQPEAGAQCTICLCGLDETEGDAAPVATVCMPCGHHFHEPCLLQWVRVHNTCPVCRHALESEAQPVPPLISMLQGWREAAATAPAADGAAGSDGADGLPGFSRTIELPLGLELNGTQMRLFHADLRRPADAPAESEATAGSASATISAAFERLSAAARAARRASGFAPSSGAGDSAPEASTAPGAAPESAADEAEGLSALPRLSVPELRRRLGTFGVNPPLSAEKLDLVRMLNLHQRVARRPAAGAAPGSQLRVQLQMQMIHQLPQPAQLAQQLPQLAQLAQMMQMAQPPAPETPNEVEPPPPAHETPAVQTAAPAAEQSTARRSGRLSQQEAGASQAEPEADTEEAQPSKRQRTSGRRG